MLDDTRAASLSIGLFGPMEVRCNGVPVRSLRTRKGLWLLALLAMRQGREVERAWLAGTLWPDSEEAAALYSLRRTLTDLRQAMGDQAARLLGPTNHTLLLERGDVFVDVIAFDEAIKRGERENLEAAVSLYRGAFLEGCDEEWVLQERTVREQGYLLTLERLAGFLMEQQQYPMATSHLHRILSIEATRESAVRLLMEAQTRSGNYAAAVQTYRALRLRLRDERSEPDPETISLYKRLRSDVRGRLNASLATPNLLASSTVSHSARPTRLATYTIPQPPNALIGREKECEEVASLLDTARLVTLTGMGGVGKTRLSLAVAGAVTVHYREGTCFVELAGVHDAQDVPSTLALALGMKSNPEIDLPVALIEFLRPMQLLLVLDNFEQVSDASPFVGQLLQRCPHLACLVTSRQLLQLSGEHEYAVEPLALPELDTDIATVLESSCVQLFSERAKAARPDFSLTHANLDAVVEICRRLEGLPLALELTAVLMRALTAPQILGRLKDRFRLLSTTRLDLTPRQRSLRGAVDWSYDLLSDRERRLFVELAVFAGTFTIDAVEQICLAEEGFETLLALRDKSLLRTVEVDGEMRYGMLDTLREYAREKRASLTDTDTWQAICARHADYYLQVANGWGASIWSGDGEAEMSGRHFESDLANIRSGMDWAVCREDAARAVPYAIALFRFLHIRGLYAEADARLSVAEGPARGSGDLNAVAGLLNRRGLIAMARGEFGKAQILFEESYSLSKASGDQAQMLLILPNLGTVAWAQLDIGKARSVWEEALGFARDASNDSQVRLLRENLGLLATDCGNYTLAEQYLRAVLELHRQDDQQVRVAHTLYNLAGMLARKGDHEKALALLEEVHRLYITLGFQPGIAHVLALIGKSHLEMGRREEAAHLASEALEIAQRLGYRIGEMAALDVLAHLAASQQKWDDVITLYKQSYDVAIRTRSLRYLVEVLFNFGMLVRNENPATTYRVLRVVCKTCRSLELEVARRAAQSCEEIASDLSPEECVALEADTPDLMSDAMLNYFTLSH